MKLISFVIPVYRNQDAVLITHEKLLKLMSGLTSINYLYEIVFVNDGSDDNSLVQLLELRKRDSNVKVISFSRNFGQVAAVVCGIKEAKGDLIVNLSADLQEPIEIIENMIQEWEAGSEIVICHRIDRQDSFVANSTSKVFYSLMKYTNPKMPEGGFDFYLMDRKAVNEFNKIDERNRFLQGDILWLGFNIKFLPYKRLKREIGKSQWSLSKKLKYFIDGLLNTSYLPLRLMSFIGMITAFAGFLYAIIIIYNRFINNIPFYGWAPIMIITLIIGGLIMLMLGIIGEYIWRIYDETRNRPMYIINEKYN